MDLKHLRTFVAVAEEQGFARAAARLTLAQPAVSKHVRDLENDLGGPLFERRPEGVRLTHAGEQLLSGGRCVLQVATGLQDRVRRAARGEKVPGLQRFIATARQIAGAAEMPSRSTG